jgi:DNA-binding NarL/FixJ family response regulator
MWRNKKAVRVASIEEMRKKSRILVIDDQVFPYQELLKRDGYDVERWAEVENLSKLTDGYFDILLLDINGVGLKESPKRQGLGILEHVKHSNPAQQVVLYSSRPQSITQREVLILADKVLDKKSEYVEYKTAIDDLLQTRFSEGYFISVMNRELGPDAALAPHAVPKALRALRKGNTERFHDYLIDALKDPETVSTVVAIISIGAKTLAAIYS